MSLSSSQSNRHDFESLEKIHEEISNLDIMFTPAENVHEDQ